MKSIFEENSEEIADSDHTNYYKYAAILLVPIVGLTALVLIAPNAGKGLFFVLCLILLLFASVCIYFLPTIFAVSDKHHNAPAIFVLNLFLGWTFLGWVIALVWSFTKK